MVGGIVASIIAIAAGAIMDFAVTASPDQHGFNVNNVGVILMIVGAVGFVISVAAYLVAGHHSVDSTVVDNEGRAAEFHQKMN